MAFQSTDFTLSPIHMRGQVSGYAVILSGSSRADTSWSGDRTITELRGSSQAADAFVLAKCNSSWPKSFR